MIKILQRTSGIDIEELQHGDIRYVESALSEIIDKTPAQDRQSILSSLLAKNSDISEDVLLLHRRRNALDTFKKLLASSRDDYARYRQKHGIKMNGKEIVWHHFLKQNSWILSYGLDIRFIDELLSEANVGMSDSSGTGSPIIDYLGLSEFTTLIELKTPEKLFFNGTRASTARASTWSFSSDFIDGISQCLAQKNALVESYKDKQIVRASDKCVDKNEVMNIDPNVIFIYGNKSKELPRDSKYEEIITKRKVLESFARNSRNVTIISFDELYHRAKQLLDSTSK